MKKLMMLLVALALLLALTACGAQTPKTPDAVGPEPDASEEQTPADAPEEPAAADAVTIDMSSAGVSFDLPAEMQQIRGVIQTAYGDEIEMGAGIWFTGLQYCAMTKEKYEELVDKGTALTQEDVDFIRDRIIDLLLVYTIDGGRTLEDAAGELTSWGLPVEGCRFIGTAGDCSFYSLADPERDVLDSLYVFDGDLREEYERLAAACAEADWIRCYEPEKPLNLVLFETADLDGNPVNSAELFGAHALTMVNLWGTYCGPCIDEMPDLAELSARLEEKNCAIIGVVVDASGRNQESVIESAKEIIADTGVAYPNLLPWDGIAGDLPSQYIPTTYFIDAEGRIVGGAAIGSRGADEYEELIDDALASLGY